MKDKFEVIGLFYTINDYKFRKYLDIKLKTSKKTNPDLMVVMMNPGSSYPVDKNDNNTKPSVAVPDRTQDQIMKVMRKASFEYARILNLSDLRTPNSKELYAFIKSEKSKDIPHTIFGSKRKKDFNSLFIKDVPIIYAWGVNSSLTELAKLAIYKIKHPCPIGLKKDSEKYAYYHPLPRTSNKQAEWVEMVSKKLSKLKKVSKRQLTLQNWQKNCKRYKYLSYS